MKSPEFGIVSVGLLMCLSLLAQPCQAPGQEAIAPSSRRPPSEQPEDAVQIARLIRQLGSERFAEREAASKALDAIGEQALPALRKAQDSTDLEIRRRVAVLVKTIEWRCTPRLRLQNTLEGHDCPVMALAFSPDSRLLASASDRDESIRLWDVAKGKTIHILPKAGFAPAFSPDGKTLASCGHRQIKLWDVANGKNFASIFAGFPVQSVVFSPDGKTISAIEKNWIVVWDREKKEEVCSWKISSRFFPVTADCSVKRPLLAVCRTRERLRNAPSFTLIDAFTGESLVDCAGNGVHFALSHDERIVASVDGLRGPHVRLWKRATGEHVATFDYPACCLALSPDAEIAALGCDRARTYAGVTVPSGFRLYEVSSGKLLTTQDEAGIGCLVFSPDGCVLASTAGQTIQLWAVPTAWRKKSK